jgi:23S rRNA (cytidine1920-2'-O)/16S rRNA (cytidine1409-2'-O)-methyltransferase
VQPKIITYLGRLTLVAKQRLDLLLIDLDLCSSRQQAQRLIRAGEVLVNRQVIDKPGTEIDPAAEIQIKQRSPFVSRGGEKLAKALATFPITVHERICLDGGISTGGFTDCLLKAGAQKVYGIDVGYGQAAWELRQDARLILRERTNIRHLKPEDLYEPDQPYPDLAVVDVSFISLTKILQPIWQLLQPPREAILLVKPQFEVGKDKVGKKGVVRSADHQAEAIAQVVQTAQALGWCYCGLTWSPLLGPAGNIEYLLWLNMESAQTVPDFAEIRYLTQTAQQKLSKASSIN